MVQEGCWDTPDYSRLDDYGVDQLYELTQGLRNDRYSRRHIVTLWNPMQSNHGANPLLVYTICCVTKQTRKDTRR